MLSPELTLWTGISRCPLPNRVSASQKVIAQQRFSPQSHREILDGWYGSSGSSNRVFSLRRCTMGDAGCLAACDMLGVVVHDLKVHEFAWASPSISDTAREMMSQVSLKHLRARYTLSRGDVCTCAPRKALPSNAHTVQSLYDSTQIAPRPVGNSNRG